jgi:catechol 2,3-dioxygenase-like lactoylglutathione lyase family enzyme
MRVSALDHLVLTVADMAATLEFYTTALGMEAINFAPADGGAARHALRFGAQKINLHDAAAPFQPAAARPTPGSADLCFLSDTPLAQWQAHLTRKGISIGIGPVPRSGATGPIVSLYLRDPDGNLIEISNPA